jgi:hypothetical protein
MATRKPMKKFKRYDDGGSVMGEMDPREAAAKKRGLDISNKEAPVGFFERIKAGNIDQPGSEAYNRFGAGRGYAQNMDDENEAMRAANRAPSAPAVPAAPAASSRPLSDPMFSDYGSNTGMGAAGTSETVKPTRPAATKPVVPSKPATSVPPLRNTGPDRSDLIKKPSLNPNFSNEGRTKPAPAAPAKPSMDIPAMRDNAKAALAEDPSALMMGGGAAAAAAAALLARTKLGKLGKLFTGAKKSTGRDLVVSPSKGPTMGKADDDRAASAYDKLKKSSFIKKKGDDVTDVTPKSTSYRSMTGSAREDARANEAREKLRNSSFIKKPKKPLDESDTTGGAVGYKRGGKTKNYASGGMVSSASRRADGIATKGKTRCKIC